MTHEAARIEIARMPLGDQARRVLFALEGSLTYGNWIRIKQADLARMIGMQPTNFNAGLRKLVAAGIVLKNPDATDQLAYRMNPDFVWKGDGASHRRAISDLNKERAKRARQQAASA